jgi:hypothetical protein
MFHFTKIHGVFIRIIATKIYGEQGSRVYSNYLLVANNAVLKNQSSLLKYRLSKHLRKPITVSMWRHLVEAWLQPNINVVKSLHEDSEESIVDEMAGHSHKTSIRYGYSSDDVIGLSAQKYYQFLKLSTKWHSMIESKDNHIVTNTKLVEKRKYGDGKIVISALIFSWFAKGSQFT